MPKNNKTTRPQDRKPKTRGSSWKSNFTELELPSGEFCEVQRPGVQGLIKAGVLESLDVLTGVVEGETIPKAMGKKKVDIESVTKDPEKLEKMMAAVDAIVIFCVTDPIVISNKVTQVLVDAPVEAGKPRFKKDDIGRLLERHERDKEAVYIDYIDDFDKMFIMNFVIGGSKDLEQFRSQSASLVAGVSDGEGA